MPRSRMAISDTGQRHHAHDFIEIAQMADAEDAARNLVEADTEGKIVAIVGVVHESCAIEAFGDKDGAHRIGMPLRRFGAEL